jgi:hypothetical protein
VPLTIPAHHALAAPILDQLYANVGCFGCTAGLSSALAEGFAYVGQTVTPAIAGNLVSVDIYAIQRPDFLIPWVIEIVNAPGGTPNGAVRSSSDLFRLPTSDGWTSVPLLTPAFFTLGESFAIVIHPNGVTGQPGLLAGDWGGGIEGGDPYPGGVPVFGPTLSQLTLEGSYPPFGQGDLLFRTFVDPVPEPATIVLLGPGIGALLGYRKKRRLRCPPIDR